MPLRLRLAVLNAVVLASAIVLLSGLAYAQLANTLRAEIDDSLQNQATSLSNLYLAREALPPRARIPSATRSGESVCSGSRCDAPNTRAITVKSAGSKDSIKACSKTRLRQVCDRGSKTAQIRAPGLRSRTARKVSCTAVG